MFLRSLVIAGFKSFPDRTEISFGGGVTAIVGPNGSGKSNVSDAIRWALGEQSPRAMRGGKMEDVIFAGTALRRGLGYAEVTLTFDNKDRALRADADEITVTRRYFRSGESDYLINKKPVRLKDVRELFMDTGLGRDGYSTIGQGRIDEILALKSEDRRDVFEEAAGITKYKYRRDEAERRLGAAGTNLGELELIISGIEERLPSLRTQSEKAKRYLLIRDELRAKELGLWLDELDEAAERSEKLAGDLGIVTFNAEETRRALDRLYEKSESDTEEQTRLNLEGESIREELRSDEGEAESLRREIAMLGASAENAAKNAEQYRSERDESARRADDIERSVKDAESAAAVTVKERDSALARVESSKKEAGDAASAAESARAETDGLRERASAAANEITAAETSRSHLAAALEKDADRKSALEESLRGARAELADVGKAIESAENALAEAEQKLADSGNVISGHKLRLEKRVEKLAEITSARDAAARERASIADRTQLLSDMEKNYEGFAGAVRLVMREAKRGGIRGVRGTVAELLRVGDENSLAIETALGAAAQNIVTDTDDTARNAIDLLKRQNGGRATFLPISVVTGSAMSEPGLSGTDGFVGIASELVECAEQYKGIVRNLLGRTAVVRDMDAALEVSRKYRHRFRVVTLDGQVINAGGSMTGGSAARSAGLFSRANELSRLRARVSELESGVERLNAELREASRLRADAEYALGIAVAERRESEDAITSAKAEKASRAAFETSLRARVESLERDLASFGEQSDKVRADERALGVKIESLRAALDEINKLASAAEERRISLERAAAEASDRAAKASADAAARDAELKSSEDSLAELRRILAVSRSAGGRVEKLIAEAERRSAEFSEKMRAAEAQLESVEEAAGEKQKSLERNTGERLEAEARRTARERETREKNERLVELEKEKLRLETAKREADAVGDEVAAKMWENYELTAAEARAQRVPVGDKSRLADEVAVLRSRLRAIGGVNTDSIAECDELSARYDELARQRADLTESKQSLEKLISEINGQMKKQFSENFTVLNTYFGETFTEIFGGGSAELALDDPGDVLGSGIEIRVKLPGKNLRVLSLLSGGEKAFVAISLYFAILKLRPAPFCVLDEIEAALDDANVDRFAKYLRKLAGAVQFIVITHRRGTMENSDVLYGVTMQEQGVTRLLSMRLEDFKDDLVE